jgi:hypothetical protein
MKANRKLNSNQITDAIYKQEDEQIEEAYQKHRAIKEKKDNPNRTGILDLVSR